MQNAELRSTADRLETALLKYVDLYAFAPVGYFTLDNSVVIHEANLAGTGLLGVERSRLTGRNFGSYIADKARSRFRNFLLKVFTSRVKESCEFPLLKTEKLPAFVQVYAELSESGQVCRFVVSDISDRKHAEIQLFEMSMQLEQRVAERTLELQISEERLQLALKAANAGIWERDMRSGENFSA
jgi:PAS domain-containing protein